MRSFLTELQSALKRELETGELLDLEKEFYDNIRKWLPTFKSDNSVEPEQKRILESRIKETIKKILLLRLIKELYFIWSTDKIPNKSLPKQEAVILNYVLNIIEEIISEGTKDHSKGELEVETILEKKSEILALISFKKPYPRLVLSDGRLLGPFSAGDIAAVPLKDAKELERVGIVEIVTSLVAGSTS